MWGSYKLKIASLSIYVIERQVSYDSLNSDCDLKNDDNEGHQRLDDTKLEGALLAKPDNIVNLKTKKRCYFTDLRILQSHLRNPML